MAGEQSIPLRVSTAAAKKDVSDFFQYVTKLSNQAGPTGPAPRVAALPSTARDQLYSSKPLKSQTNDVKDQTRAYKDLAENQAKLLALNIEANRVARRSTGLMGVDATAEARMLKDALAALEAQVGKPLTGHQKSGFATRTENQMKRMSANYSSLDGDDLAKGFAATANQVMQDLGIEGTATVRSARELQKEMSTQLGYETQTTQSKKKKAAAEAKAAADSEKSAAVAVNEDAKQSKSEREITRNKQRESSGSKRQADASGGGSGSGGGGGGGGGIGSSLGPDDNSDENFFRRVSHGMEDDPFASAEKRVREAFEEWARTIAFIAKADLDGYTRRSAEYEILEAHIRANINTMAAGLTIADADGNKLGMGTIRAQDAYSEDLITAEAAKEIASNEEYLAARALRTDAEERLAIADAKLLNETDASAKRRAQLENERNKAANDVRNLLAEEEAVIKSTVASRGKMQISLNEAQIAYLQSAEGAKLLASEVRKSATRQQGRIAATDPDDVAQTRVSRAGLEASVQENLAADKEYQKIQRRLAAAKTRQEKNQRELAALDEKDIHNKARIAALIKEEEARVRQLNAANTKLIAEKGRAVIAEQNARRDFLGTDLGRDEVRATDAARTARQQVSAEVADPEELASLETAQKRLAAEIREITVISEEYQAALAQSASLLAVQNAGIMETLSVDEQYQAARATQTILAARQANVDAQTRAGDTVLQQETYRTGLLSKIAKVEAEILHLETAEGQEQARQLGLAKQRSHLMQAQINAPDNWWGRTATKMGYSPNVAQSPLSFFGTGALSSIRYGLPSMLMYGAVSGIGNTIKEAEEFEYNLKRLEGQFEALFAGQDFGPIREEIMGVAKDTGLAADELTEFRIQLTGAFAQENIRVDGIMKTGLELVSAQSEAAARLAQTIHLPLAEITDGLTAASLAFERSFEDIGDVALALEQRSGVLARETISFIGDIAPVAQEAGYELEEFAAIAAIAQQRSGRSGTALAEAFGRVIPAISEAKDDLYELMAIEPSLMTDTFADAIRDSDVKQIFAEIGQSYVDMSAESKQRVIKLLGGRREAQAIIPALANPEAIERYVEVASNAAGTLDTRFKDIQDTLNNAFARFSESIRQLGIEILELGLADAIENVMTALKAMMSVLSPILQAVTSINDLFSGLPAQILLGVAAFKTLRSLMTVTGEDGTKTIMGQAMLARSMNRIGTFRERPFSTFRDARDARINAINSRVTGWRQPYSNWDPRVGQYTSIPTRVAGPPMPIYGPQAGRFAGIGSGLAASSRNLLSLIGGGSAAMGGVTVGIGALLAANTFISNRVESTREELQTYIKQLREESSELDLDDELTLMRRIESIRASALQRSDARPYTWLVGPQGLDLSPREYIEAEVERLRALSTGVQEYFANIDSILEQELTELFRRDLEELTGFDWDEERSSMSWVTGEKPDIEGIQEVIQNRMDRRGRSNILKAAWGALTDTFVHNNDYMRYDFTESQREVIEEAKEILGIQGNATDAVLEAIFGQDGDVPNTIAALEEILSLESSSPEDIRGATEALEGLRALGEEDSGFRNSVREAERLQKELTAVERSNLELDRLSDAYEAGIIGFNEYMDRTAAELNRRREILRLGASAPSSDEMLDAVQAIQAQYKEQADIILSRQEDISKIADVLGQTEDEANRATMDNALANIADPNFRDEDALFEQALQFVEAKKALALSQAEDANDLEEIARLRSEGVDIDFDVALILTLREAFSENGILEGAANSYKTVHDSLIDVVNSERVGLQEEINSIVNEMGSLREIIDTGSPAASTKSSGRLSELEEEYRELVTKNLQTDYRGIQEAMEAIDPDTILQDVMSQVSEQGFVDPDLVNTLKYALGAAGTKSQEEGLSDDDKKAIENSITFLSSLLMLAGWSESEIREFLGSSAPDATVDLDPLVRKAENLTAKISEDEAKRAADKQYDYDMALFEFRKFQANQNQLEIAAIEREQAARMREKAETLSGIERDMARLDAQKMALQASRTESSAWTAIRTAVVDAQIEMAKIMGDEVGAAILAVQLMDIEIQQAIADNVDPRIVEAMRMRRRGLEFAVGDARVAESLSFVSLFGALYEFRGDTLGVLETELRAAEIELSNARGNIAVNAANERLLAARAALRDYHAEAAQRAFALQAAETNDPVEQARIAERAARRALSDAVGLIAQEDAQINLINVQRQLNEAMNEARYSMFALRQAELDAMGDSVGSAQNALALAREQLNDLIAAGAGTTAINNQRAAVITADKAARDAVFNDKMEEYQWLLDMGKISKSQFITYLEGLKSALEPGTKQFRDLELTLKRLRDDIGSDLMYNLPTNIMGPTLYDVRRFSPQSPEYGAGYVDNRTQTISVVINRDMSEDEIIRVLDEALGNNRSGSGARRF